MVQTGLRLAKKQKFQKVLLRASYQSSEKLQIATIKSNNDTIKDNYTDIFNNKINKFQLFIVSDDIVKKFRLV